MLIKRIICKVREHQRNSFFEYQKQWSKLDSMQGFIGQLGGWSRDQELTAYIYAFWETRQDYDFFMGNAHDEIFFNSDQESTYSSIEVQLYEEIGSVLNSATEMSDLIRQSQYIRVCIVHVKKDKEENFINKQDENWNPGVTAEDGVMDGTYAFSQPERDHIMILTGWRDEVSLRKYVESDFPVASAVELMKEAVEIKSEGIKVENAWRVLKKSGH